MKPDTFEFALPDGEKVRAWQSQREVIREDVRRYGKVILVRSAKDPEVFDRVAPDSVESIYHQTSPRTRRVS